MFPSNSTYSDHPFDFETYPLSKQESVVNCDDEFSNLSFFHDFPSSPFDDYEFFMNQQHCDVLEPEQHAQQPEEPQQAVNKAKVNGVKRPWKRDRHSKIKTARGLRDRRMRLSLQVAKRFFHLQDMLGFEKASKTVEWLLNQAKEEIKQVASKTASTFECELGLSSQEEQKKLKGVKRRTKVRSRKISVFHHPLAKVCREKARERARERTKEKMRSKQCEIEATNHCLTTQLGF